MAVGPHVYADSQRIIEEIELLAGKQLYPAETKYALPGLKLLGDRVFRTAIFAIPAQAISEEFVKDRVTVFPEIKNPNFKHIRPYALGELRAMFSEIQEELLGNGEKKWVAGGSSPTLADAHVIWSVRWTLKSLGLGQEEGLTPKDFPGIHDWVERYSEITGKDDAPKLSGEEAKKIILGAVESAQVDASIDSTDPLELSKGEQVQIYPTDADPTHPQKGSLVILTQKEVAVQLDNKAIIHFPRIGYRIVKEGAALV